MKILVVEKDTDLSARIAASLQHEKYSCEVVMNYNDALDLLSQHPYNVIIMNSAIQVSDDHELIRDIKSIGPNMGIILLSHTDSMEEKVAALEAGADDFLVTPFQMPELIARVKSVIRRCGFDGNNEIILDDMIFRLDSMSVEVNNQPLLLTRKEYDLLSYLLANRNRVVSKQAIAGHLREDDDALLESFDFIYSHIRNIRKKILQKGGRDHIVSVYGIGYMLAEH